ncbi:MAG: hypothetical protein A3H96_06820 [Acidobacteria bacterium RIFCSPLOWO2_02_FULL_67_36]|nr:MAG: hypothetical protein A3H96_06820 [Acidobacteria bacterium RIFCSPLOWO2_02_FULL_67_36]OFW21312.1 MAG: hypothetical protein A3G21_11635 [Acidobacteria bacterium RIFCSPLOWO2_12_FULL_66_21]
MGRVGDHHRSTGHRRQRRRLDGLIQIRWLYTLTPPLTTAHGTKHTKHTKHTKTDQKKMWRTLAAVAWRGAIEPRDARPATPAQELHGAGARWHPASRAGSVFVSFMSFVTQDRRRVQRCGG